MCILKSILCDAGGRVNSFRQFETSTDEIQSDCEFRIPLANVNGIALGFITIKESCFNKIISIAILAKYFGDHFFFHESLASKI